MVMYVDTSMNAYTYTIVSPYAISSLKYYLYASNAFQLLVGHLLRTYLVVCGTGVVHHLCKCLLVKLLFLNLL